LKSRIFVIAIFVVSTLAGCSSGSTYVESSSQPDSQEVQQDSSSELPISELLVGQEDFSSNLSKVEDSMIYEHDSAMHGVFPYECPGITNELLSHTDRGIVKFSVPANFADATRNNDFEVIQEVFRFDTSADAEAVLDAVQAALSNDCYFDGFFSEYVTNFKKLTLSDGPFIGFTWGMEQSQTPNTLCGQELAVFRSTYWAHISSRDIYLTHAKGTECMSDPENSFYSDTVNAGVDAVNSLGR